MSIIVFTDGACSGNGKASAKGGVGIHFPNKECNDISQKFAESPITNQRAELYAIQLALETIIIKERIYDNIMIYSDSLYSIKSLTEWIKNWEKNNWKNANGKPVKNLDLIRPIYRTIKNIKGKVTFTHVKAHTGGSSFEAIGNDKADKLATSGACL